MSSTTTTTEQLATKLAVQHARQRDAVRATQEYEAKRTATLLRTERLRAERLEREAAAAAAAEADSVEREASARKAAKRARR